MAKIWEKKERSEEAQKTETALSINDVQKQNWRLKLNCNHQSSRSTQSSKKSGYQIMAHIKKFNHCYFSASSPKLGSADKTLIIAEFFKKITTDSNTPIQRGFKSMPP